MTTLLGALCLTLAAACRPVPASIAPAASAPSSIQDEGDSYLLRFSEDPRDPFDLLELVKLCQEATDVSFTCDEATRGLLESSPVVLLGPKRVRKCELYDFVQLQLWTADFTCTEIGPPPIALVRVQSLRQDARGTLQQRMAATSPRDLARESLDLVPLQDGNRAARPRSAAPASSVLENPALPPR